jgi:tetratricopeptide (TPR) repeat protein
VKTSRSLGLIAVVSLALVVPAVTAASTSLNDRQDWNNGSLDNTTADREDGSGVLGLGYGNGTSNDSLIGYWRMDRTSGEFPDYSGNSLTGDIFGADRTSEGVFGTSGANFTGNSEEAVILDDSRLDLQEGFTISTWVKLNEDVDIEPSMSQNPSFYQKGTAYDLRVENPKTIAYSTGSSIVFLDSAGTRDEVSVTANAIGTLRDFDTDNELEVPFVDANNNLKLVDRNGETETLVSGGVKAQSTTLGTGDLSGNSPNSVFYIDTSDSTINEYDYDGTSTDHGITATAVSGVSDYDGNGNNDIVYLDSTQELSYWNPTDGKTGTGRAITGGSSFQYWMAGTIGPNVAKYDSGWTDLNSNIANEIHSGAISPSFYYFAGSNGEFTKYDGNNFIEDDSPYGSQINGLSFNGSHILAVTGNQEAATYSEETDTWTQQNPNVKAGTFQSAANSYGGEIGEFWLIGHDRTGGNPKAYITKFDGSTFTRLSSSTDVLGGTVEALSFNGTHYLAGDGTGSTATYDGSSFKSLDNRFSRTDTIYAVEGGSLNGESLWMVGGSSSRLEIAYHNGSYVDLTNSIGFEVRSIDYSEKEQAFLIAGGNGNVVKYDSSGLTDISPTSLGNSVETIKYNPSSSIKKLGSPSDLEGDETVEVPIVNSNNNLELVRSDGSSDVVDSNYGSASETPLGVLDWTGNPDREILHVDSGTGELETSTVGGSVSTVTDSSGASLSGIDAEAGVAAGSRPETIPVLQINGGFGLNREGVALNTSRWSLLTVTYNASTGDASIFVDERRIASGSNGEETVNLNSDDFKLANGDITTVMDEARVYNASDAGIVNDRLFSNASTGSFGGEFTSQVYNPEGKVSWNNLSLNLNKPASTSLTAEVLSLDSSGNQKDSISFTASQGNSSLDSLQNSRKFQVRFTGTTDSVLETWEVLDSTVYYEEALKADGVTSSDYTNLHSYNISGVGVHADGQENIASCTAYYSPEGDSTFYDIENYGASTSENSLGGNRLACNSTINSSVEGIGYGPGDTDNASFRFEFSDSEGYTVQTVTKSKVLPNRQPEVKSTGTTDLGSHTFSYTAYADDQDQSSNEIQSCTVYAEDQDGNQHQFSNLGSPEGYDASCSAEIDNSLSGFEVGEDIDVWSEFTDKAGATSQSSIRTQTIPNEPPVIDSGPGFDQASSGHSFEVSAVASDPDGDSGEIGRCTVFAEDGDGYSEKFSGSGYLNEGYGSQDQVACNVSVSDSVSGFEVGESITTDVMFSDIHGSETSNVTGTESIPNNPPGVPDDLNMSYFLEQGDIDNVVDHAPRINWSNPSDPDGDNISVRAYTESSASPDRLDNETSPPENEMLLGQEVTLQDGTYYNVSLRACDNWSCSGYSRNLEFRMNEEPAIREVSLSDSSPNGGDEIQVEADVSDPGGVEWTNFTVYNQSSSEIIYENVKGTVNDGLWKSDSFVVLAGNTYNWSLTTSDGYENSSSSGTFSVSNSPPQAITSLQSSVHPFGHRTNLSAIAYEPDGQSDIDEYSITLEDGQGNSETFSKSVNKNIGNNSEVAANFSNLNSSIEGFEVEEEITATITFIDSGGNTDSVSGTRQIPNHAPGTPSDINMSDFFGDSQDIDHVTDHSPRINWSNPENLDNDSVTIRAYTGTSPDPTSLDNSLNIGEDYGPFQNLTLGQDVSLEDGTSYNISLIACDEWDCSTGSENLEFHMNEEPSIDSVKLNDSSPTGSDRVRLLSNVSDSEDTIDDVRFTVWNTDSDSLVLDEAQASDLENQKVSDGFEVYADTSYNWTLNASDGYEHSVSTGSFSVPNTAPSIESGPSFHDYSNGHKFNVSAVASDVDGEVNIDNYTISLDDGDQVYEFTNEVNQEFGSGEQAAANFSNVNASDVLSGFEVGETIFVTVVFRDKSGETAENFDNHVIPNHQPSQASSFDMESLLSPGADIDHVTDDTPEIKFNTPSDPDEDTLTVKIFTESSPDPTQLDREVTIDSTEYDSEKTVSLGNQVNLVDGVSYNVSVQTCDEYGSCTDKRKVNDFHMNEEPSLDSIKLNKSASDLVSGDLVHLTANISDNESDSIEWANFTVWDQSDSTNIYKSINGSITEVGSWKSKNWTVSTGTTYNWTLNSTDGFETSATTGSFTTSNANPETVSGPTFTNIEGEHAFNISAVIRDPDGESDLESYTIEMEDGDGNTRTATNSFSNLDFGTGDEAAINYSSVNSSMEGFEVTESISVQISFQDDEQASGQTDTRSHEIPNTAPGKPTDENMQEFLTDGEDLDHVLDHSPKIGWTAPTDAEGDQVTITAYTGTSTDPSTVDNTTSSGDTMLLGQQVQLLDGESYNVVLEACDPWSCSTRTDNIGFTMNEEPVIESVDLNKTSPTGSEEVKLLADITNPSDPTEWTNFTVYNENSGEAIIENLNGSSTTDYWVSESWTTNASTTYNYTVITTDGYESTQATDTIEIGNERPVLEDIFFEDYSNGHRFNVSATAEDLDGAADIDRFDITISDGDGNTRVIEGDVNRSFGGEDQASLNYSNINSSIDGLETEETVNVEVEVVDRSGSSSSSSREHTIPNHAPELASGLDLEVDNPDHVVKHQFKISWTNPSDQDGDNLTVSAYLGTAQDPLTVDNSTAITEEDYGQNSHMIVGENTGLDDNTDYNLDLVVCDDWDCTSREVNASFHMNEEPVIDSVEINESVSREAEWIHLVGNATDTDNQVETAYYEIWNQTDQMLLVDEKIESTSDSSDPWRTWNSSAFYGESLQTYNWSFTVSDGFENTTSSDEFEVGNAEPSIERGIQFSDIEDEHGFNVSLLASDINGDSDLANFTVIADDGEETHSYTRQFEADGDDNSWANYSNINSSIAGFEVDESISVQVVVRDDHGLNAYSSTVSKSIPNRAPSIEGISLDPSNPTTEDTLNLSYDVNDPEDDEISKTFYDWTSNSTSESSRTVSPSDTEEGQHWNLSLQVADEFNALSDENPADTTLVIQNSLPAIDQPPSFDNISDRHAFVASAVAEDPNGDEDLKDTCDITVSDGNNQQTYSTDIDRTYSGGDRAECSYEVNTDLESWIDPQDKLDVTVTFEDEEEPVSTDTVTATVPNREPSVNELASPANNTNITESEVQFNWTASDPEGDDLSYDLRIYNETEEIRTVTSLETSDKTVSDLQSSEIEWEVEAYDSYENNQLSSTVSDRGNLLVDHRPPQPETKGIEVVNASNSPPLQNQSVRCYSRWSDNFELGEAEIYENATDTNHSIGNEEFGSGWANMTISSSELNAGTLKCEFYASDHLDNTNSSKAVTEVADIEKPNITGFEYGPEQQSELDPESPVYVNATIEDNLKLDTATLEYRKEGGDWQTGTADSDGDRYQGSFTPEESGTTYEFRYRAEDTYGNVREVNDSVYVEWDYNWQRSPEDYEGSSTLENNLIDYSPIQIENNGDFGLEYTLQAEAESNLKIGLDRYEVYVPAGETRSIGVDASLNEAESDDEGLYQFMIFVDSVNDTATPQSENISGTSTFTLDSPYLSMSRGDEFPLSTTAGSTGVELPVVVGNDGAEKSVDTDLEYDLPDSWESGSTRVSLGNISTGDSKEGSIQVDIPEDAETGTYTVNTTSTTGDRTFSQAFDIDITSNTTETIVEEDGGGGGAAPSEPSQEQRVEGTEDRFFNTSENFEIVRGEDQEFSFKLENPTEYNLTNISIEVSGIQSRYLELETDYIESLPVNSSENVTVNITAPDYFQTGDYTLNFNISGKGEEPLGLYTTYFDFNLEKQINLGVKEIPRENASELVNRSKELRGELNSSGINTETLEEMIADVETEYESGEYGSVRESYEQIEEQYTTAKEVDSGLKELRSQVESAQAQGLSVGNARRVMNLAEAAMERGAYDTAAERLEEARNIYQLETAGEVNWIYEITSNWKKVVAGIFILSTGGFLAWLRYRLYKINRRLDALRNEEESIEELKVEAQRKTFEEKEMSLSEYEDATEDYNDEIVDIIEERVSLETARANITNFKRRDSLAQERDKLEELIKETQEQYVEGNIGDSDIYEEKVEELTERLSEVEGQIAEIDARAEVRSTHRIGRIMEKIPLISSGGVRK